MLIEKARIEFMSRAKENTDKEVYAGVVKDEVLTISSSGPCHANVRSWERFKQDYILSSVQHMLPLAVEKPLRHQFFNWLINTGPYADAFASKDVEEVDEWGLVLNTKLPGGYLLGALIASRFPTESHCGDKTITNCCKLWGELVNDYGVAPSRAYVLSLLFQKQDKKKLYYSSVYSNHVALYPSRYGKKYIHNFENRKFVDPDDDYYNTGRCGGAATIWGTSSGNIGEFCKALKPRRDVKVVNHNIFATFKADGTTVFSTKEEIANLIEDFNFYVDGEQKNESVPRKRRLAG